MRILRGRGEAERKDALLCAMLHGEQLYTGTPECVCSSPRNDQTLSKEPHMARVEARNAC